VSDCQLAVEPFFQCCCNCKHHWQDFHHCTTAPADLPQKKKGRCACSVPKGWICVGLRAVGDGSIGVYSGWPEHSIGCEMYSPIKLKELK